MTFLPAFRMAAVLATLSLTTTVLFAEEPGGTLFLANLQADQSQNWQTRLWATPYGNWDHCQTDGAADGFRTETFGLMAGFDRRRNSRLTWGWGAGGSWISATSDKGLGGKSIDAFKTMFVGQIEEKDWRFSLTGGYGHNTQTTDRRTFDGLFLGNNHADQWGLTADFGLKYGAGFDEIEPFFGAECHTFSESGYAEKRIAGVGSPLSFGRSTEDSFATRVGIRYRWRQTGNLVVWRPELSAVWLHEFGSERLVRSSQLDPFPTFYTFPDTKMKRDHLLFSVGIVGNLGSTMDIFARYATDIAGDYVAHGVQCGTHWKF